MDNYNEYLKKNYKQLLVLISENIKNKKDKKFVLSNLDYLSNKFLELSETIHNLSDIVINNLNYNKQKSLIKKKYNFSEKESKKLLDNILLKNLNKTEINQLSVSTLRGGAKQNESLGESSEEVGKTVSSALNICMFNLPKLSLKVLLNLPSIFMQMMATWFQFLSDTFNLRNTPVEDFKKPLDYMYLFLFVLASVPFMGAIADFITICRAIYQKRIFLACMVYTTRFISFFASYNLFDMGAIMKILYSLDNYSYLRYSIKLQDKSDTDSSKQPPSSIDSSETETSQDKSDTDSSKQSPSSIDSSETETSQETNFKNTQKNYLKLQSKN